MAKMKEQNKTSEKELNETDIVKLSEAEFKTLVIRMLGELTEYGNNIKGEMKVTSREIKKNIQPWLVWFSGLCAGLQTNAGSIPSQGTCLGCGPGPQ